MRTSKDLYGLLELSRGASREDVRKAYRRMVREYHPDTNPGDDSAEERFKEFQHAYELLSDLRKRREYDDEVLLRASAGLVPKLLDFHNNPRVNSWKTCVSVLALFLIIDGFLFYRYGQQDNSVPSPPRLPPDRKASLLQLRTAKADEQERKRRRTILISMLSTKNSRIVLLTFEKPSLWPQRI